MAVPTQVRVESNSQVSATLRWLYGGANVVGIYRSTDASIYTLIGSAVVGTVIYTDSTLAIGTRYYYKLSDDSGANYSLVVSVISQICIPPSSNNDTLILPRFGSGSDPVPIAVDPETLDVAMEEIEKVVTDQVTAPRSCDVCIENGSVVFDCSSGCSLFEVIVTEDVNSISIVNCGDQEPPVDWIVPPGSPRGICGWPVGAGFGGDECTQAPIAGGRTASTGPARSPKSKPATAPFEGTGGGGSGGCGCVPGAGNTLTIKSCNANNSLKCSTLKSLKLLACGGRGPYTWSRTGTVQLKGPADITPGTTASGASIIVTPPTNTGSAVAGTAYKRPFLTALNAFPVVSVSLFAGNYGCNDQYLSANGLATCNSPNATCDDLTFFAGILPPVTCGDLVCGDVNWTPCNFTANSPACGTDQQNAALAPRAIDTRTGPMIAAGCAPCTIVAMAATVTVTDAVGTSVTIVLTP